MAKLFVDGRLARTLSALGGRNLHKTGELLAGNLALMLGAKVKSDGKKILIFKNDETITLTPLPGKPVFRGRYYVYQKGSFEFEAKKRKLEQVKQLMLEMIPERKEYLLERYDSSKLEEYGIEMDYVLELQEQVNSLEVEQ